MASHSPIEKQVLLQFKSRLQRQQGELRHVIEKTDKDVRALADQGTLDHSFKESVFARSSQVQKQLRLVNLHWTAFTTANLASARSVMT